MKVLSVRGNKVTLEMSKDEENIFFRYGLQLWIDGKIGKNKFVVLPVDKNFKLDEPIKPLTKKEIKEEEVFSKELLTLAVNEALRAYLNKQDHIVESCCDNEDRGMNGGCKNCGAPSF